MLNIINFAIDYARAGMYFRSHFAGRSNPVLSWGALSARANARQSAYRVTAGEYDSGWVESELQEARLPEGTLLPGVRTEVTVQIRDDAGNESAPYSDYIYNAFIDWDAPWIGDPEAPREQAVYLRKKFTVKPALKSARIYACGLGYQNVLLNGCNIEGARLDPAYTDFSRRVNYVFYPDADLYPEQGENVLSAIVGAGWRDNRGVHQNDWLKDASFRFEGPQQFTAMLFLEYEDGTTEVVKTGSDWEAGEGPMRECSLFNGSTYDARVPETYPRSAAILPAPGGKMEPMLIPPVRDTAHRQPIAAWPDGEDAVIFDFGQNIAGVLFLPIPDKLAPGQRIEITHSEELTEDGRLFRETLRSARAEDVYIAAGDERDLGFFLPQFTYHGFRYARIAGLGADFDARWVSAVELRTDADSRSTFRCGNALVTRIHEICVATERANIHSILTDCPQRDERMGWLNDATVRFESTPYNMDIGALFPKVVRDVMDVQTKEGAIGCTAPYVGGSIPADPVCSSFLIAGWEALMHTGNLDIVREAYPAFAAWENCLLAHSDDYIVNYSYYGDWAGPVDCCVGAPDPSNPGAVSAVTPGIFMSTGYSYFNCALLAKMADRLGLPDEAARHRETAERVKNALIGKWYDAVSGIFATGSQACQAFPLWLGIAPDPEKAAARLHDAVAAAGYRLTTGNLCSRYLFDALAKHGYLEDAWRLLIREEYPSLGFMIQQEATTVWERFELMTNPCMNSHAHPMYAAVDYFLYAYLAGVRPTEPGWRAFAVEPYLPKHLMSAQATVDTPLGEVSVRWVKRYDGAHLTVNVPFGARAEIRFGGEAHAVGSGFHTFRAALADA